MSSKRVSARDKADLGEFTKYLALKATQIIVQSRLGEKIQTQSKPYFSEAHCFNLSTYDIPEVLEETKKALSGKTITVKKPLCVEILLRTVEGDTMMLETWCLGALPEYCDSSLGPTITLYCRMGILLKSLLTTTRALPAYKFSRKQSPDSYIIGYRIYMGEPEVNSLGDEYKEVRVGQIYTLIGMIYISVFYRTKMTIAMQMISKHTSVIVKKEHFMSDIISKHCDNQNNVNISDSRLEIMETEHQQIADECIPVTSSSNLHIPRPSSQNFNQENKNSETSQKEDSMEIEVIDLEPEEEPNKNETGSVTSQIDLETSRLLELNLREFVVVDWETPFSSTDPNMDLKTFYKEFQNAPPLQAFDQQSTTGGSFNDVVEQIQAFDRSATKFEQLLSVFLNK